MGAPVFGQSAVQIISGANIESSGGLALEDVEEGRYGRNGRPVGTRTPDLADLVGPL